MFWTFLTTFVVLAAFMLVLALGTILGRRKRECSCKAASRIMADKTRSGRAMGSGRVSDSPLKILGPNGGCDCADQ